MLTNYAKPVESNDVLKIAFEEEPELASEEFEFKILK